MDVADKLQNAVEEGVRTLSQLVSLLNWWRNAPEQLYKLRDEVDRLCSLLNCIQREQEMPLTAADSSQRSFLKSIAHARLSMQKLRSLLTKDFDVENGSEARSADGFRHTDANLYCRERWRLRQDDFASIQRSIQSALQRILSRAVALNL